MADITVGQLPQASAFDRESLLLVENQGVAQKVTGALVQDAVFSLKVSAETLPSGSDAYANKVESAGSYEIIFGLPAGYTPQKGMDYWTAVDLQQMVSDVLEALPVYNGEVSEA